MNLRPYQQEIIEKTRQSWQAGHKHNIICLPCGARQNRFVRLYGRANH